MCTDDLNISIIICKIADALLYKLSSVYCTYCKVSSKKSLFTILLYLKNIDSNVYLKNKLKDISKCLLEQYFFVNETDVVFLTLHDRWK